jgi:hypothetical protein
MLLRIASFGAIASVCAVITALLWYAYQRDVSLWLGILLFVVASFAVKVELLGASLAFAAIATLLLPVAALFASFVPSFGFAGAVACFPEGFLDYPSHSLDSLLLGLLLALVFHVGLRRIHGL